MTKKKKITVDYNNIEKQIFNLVEPLAAQAGAELIDIEYIKEAGNWFLRLFIDREPPVDHDLCQQVSELASNALDQSDPIPDSYYLEVSSPGLERPLRRAADFDRFGGRPVAVKLYAPQDGTKEFRGTLIGLADGQIIIDADGTKQVFEQDLVAKVHLIADI